MLVFITAIMMLQYAVIYECCFDRGLVCFISTPIQFPCGAVVLFGTGHCVVHTVYSYVFGSGFLYFMGLSTFIFQHLASLHVRLQQVILWQKNDTKHLGTVAVSQPFL
jgi:hypothetical protein